MATVTETPKARTAVKPKETLPRPKASMALKPTSSMPKKKARESVMPKVDLPSLIAEIRELQRQRVTTVAALATDAFPRMNAFFQFNPLSRVACRAPHLHLSQRGDQHPDHHGVGAPSK